MNENELEVKKTLEARGWMVLRNGWPDFLCIQRVGDGYYIRAVEVKTDTDSVRPEQAVMHEWLKCAGIATAIVRPDFDGEIDWLFNPRAQLKKDEAIEHLQGLQGEVEEVRKDLDSLRKLTSSLLEGIQTATRTVNRLLEDGISCERRFRWLDSSIANSSGVLTKSLAIDEEQAKPEKDNDRFYPIDVLRIQDAENEIERLNSLRSAVAPHVSERGRRGRLCECGAIKKTYQRVCEKCWTGIKRGATGVTVGVVGDSLTF